MPVLFYPHSRKVLPNVHREPLVFLSAPTASCSGTRHTPLSRTWLCLFAFSLQAFTQIGKTPLSLLFCRLDSPSSLSLSSVEGFSSPFVIFMPIQLGLFQCVPLLASYWTLHHLPLPSGFHSPPEFWPSSLSAHSAHTSAASLWGSYEEQCLPGLQ